MKKTLSKILEGYLDDYMTQDTQKFIKSHTVMTPKGDDKTGTSDDKLFKASNIKQTAVGGPKKIHGYKNPEDEKAYDPQAEKPALPKPVKEEKKHAKDCECEKCENEKEEMKEEDQLDEISNRAKSAYLGTAVADLTARSQEHGYNRAKKKKDLGDNARKIMNRQDGIYRATKGMREEADLAEKTLTPAEIKKREEIARAMERQHPGMDKSKKMAIATAAAKRVAEAVDDFRASPAPTTASKKSDRADIPDSQKDRLPSTDKVGNSTVQNKDNTSTVTKSSKDTVTGPLTKVYSEEAGKRAARAALAALAPPKDKVTHKDILVGRGVLKQHPTNPNKHVLAKEEEIHEAGMPASVIKSKQDMANMSDAEFAKKHGNKSEKELRDMAARHGYGWNKATKTGSDHYVKRVAAGLKEDVALDEAKRGRPSKTNPEQNIEPIQTQLQKMHKQHEVDVTFADKSKHTIPREHANKALKHLSSLKPIARDEVQKHMSSSKQGFYDALAGKKQESKPKITLAKLGSMGVTKKQSTTASKVSDEAIEKKKTGGDD